MELRLCLIRSPQYPDTINVDEDLQDYFSEPRRVKLNDQITIRPLLQPGINRLEIIIFFDLVVCLTFRIRSSFSYFISNW
jgi:hypothetical protein